MSNEILSTTRYTVCMYSMYITYIYIIIYNSYENTINSCTLFKAKIVTFSGNKHRIFSPAPPALYVASFPGSLWERNRPWKKSHTTGISRNIVIQWSCGMPFHLKWDAYHIYGSRFFPCFLFLFFFLVFVHICSWFFPSLRVIVCPSRSAGAILQDILRTILPRWKPLRTTFIHPTWHVKMFLVLPHSLEKNSLQTNFTTLCVGEKNLTPSSNETMSPYGCFLK